MWNNLTYVEPNADCAGIYCQLYRCATVLIPRCMKLSAYFLCAQRIPEDFASRYCKNMLNPVYLEVPSGEVWEVEVVHSHGQICLGIGWQDFSDFYSISCGHFLMFGYNARSHFNVTIFDLSASEIEYSYSSAHGIHTPISYSHETCHVPERDQSESDDSVEILEGIPRSQKAEAIIPHMVENSVENLDYCPLGQSSKGQRLEGDAEDDVFADVHIKRKKVEKLQEHVASHSFIRNGQKRNKDCRTHKQQSESVYGQHKAVMDKERAVAYQRAKAFKSKNPFIISFMQPSYVFSPFSLTVALKFARKYFLENYGSLVLRVPGRGSGSWSVKCTTRGTNATIYSGWKAFVLDNKLKCGDACVFEVIKGTRLFIDVTIFGAAGSTLMHKIVGVVPGGCDGKSNVIKTDNCVPCSQPKVVHTKKVKQRTEEHGECTEIEHSVEILSHGPLAHGSKRKEPEGEGDVSIDIHTRSVNVENKQEDADLPSITRKTKRSGESCRMHKQKSKVVYPMNKTVLDKEMSIAYQRAKAFKSENPFVIYFMQPSYVSKPYSLQISLLFAVKYFRENCGNLVLRVPGRGSWLVKYALGNSKSKICFSWKALYSTIS